MANQRPIKGFRPGKEPPRLKKQRAKQQFGELSGTQERLVDLFAERTPEESSALIGKWIVGMFAAAAFLAAGAVGLALWSWIAAGIAGVLAGVAFFLGWRLRRQREQFEEMAETVAGGGRRR